MFVVQIIGIRSDKFKPQIQIKKQSHKDMSLYPFYVKIFQNSIEPDQQYEKIAVQILTQVDADSNPCIKYDRLAFLSNYMHTKSETCSTSKWLFPFITNYHRITLNRAKFFEREAEKSLTQCIRTREDQMIKERFTHEAELRSIEENTKIHIEQIREATERERIQAQKQFSEKITGSRKPK